MTVLAHPKIIASLALGLVLSLAAPVMAQGMQDAAVTAPKQIFDAYAHRVMDLKIGMTRNEAAAILEEKHTLQLANIYSGEMLKRYGTEMKEMPTLECTTLNFRLREMTAGDGMPRIMLNLTYPMPDEPQGIWSIAFVNKFKPDQPLNDLYSALVERFGQPSREVPSTIHGGRTLFYGENLRFKPNFDNSNPVQAGRGITGMWIEIKGPENTRPWGELRIQIGDYNLWLEAEDKARRYHAQVMRDPQRCVTRQTGTLSTGNIDF